MKCSTIVAALTLVTCSTALLAQVPLATSGNTPPVAPKIPKDVTVHGDKRIDDYFWLRDRTNPAVIEYLRAEDNYTDAVMAPTQALRDTLYKEMVARIKETDSSAPYPDGAWLYYSRTEQGKQYRIYCRKPRQGDPGSEQVLVDLNELGKGEKFIGIGSYNVSNDGNLLAYSIDKTGHRDYELFVKDLRTGSLLPQKVGTVSSVAWASDNATLFFTQEDPVSKRSYKLGRCDLASGKIDVLYEEKDENFGVELGASLDRK